MHITVYIMFHFEYLEGLFLSEGLIFEEIKDINFY